MDAMMADDMSVKSNPSWTAFDPITSHLPGNDSLLSNPNFSYPMSQGCTCNGLTGPCTRHLEEMRFQILNTNIGTPPHFMSPYARSRAGSQYEASLGPSAAAYEGSSSGNADIPQQLQEILHHKPSQSSLSTSTSASASASNVQNHPKSPHCQPNRYNSGSNGASKLSARSPLSPPGSISGAPNTPPMSESSTSSLTAVTSSSDADITRNEQASNKNHDNDAASNTSRFKPVLDAVKAAGFPDFDRMVAAYYTAPFEKSSVPAMAQRASRGRRLAKMLRDVHESSNQWPRWEARGFRESAMESARTICVEEIEKVARHLDRSRSPGGRESRSILNGLRISDANANGMSIEADSSEESRLLAQLTTLPEDVEAVVQDEAPHLWSLFTELAGPQSLYCDRVSQAVLALLIDGRRS